MEVLLKAVAQDCLDGACQNRMSFPESLRVLTRAGFEGYGVDYRLNTRTYYLPGGETLVLKNPHDYGPVGAAFNEPEIVAAIRWAQLAPPDYSYLEFNRRVTASGCAGYMVSILGRHVLYFGRTAETHVEHFPT